jgi:iron complex outermembrane recepter protein
VAGAEALRAAGVAGVPTYPLELGEPYYEAFKFVWNAGLELTDSLEGYVFGNYLSSDSTVGFSYRQSAPGGGFPAHSSYRDSAFDGTPAHPQIFDLAALYPGGYVPQFSGDQTDFSTVAGVKHDTGGPFTFDVSARYGANEIDYTLENTINSSLGVDSPTRFKPGSLTQRETEASAEASYKLSDALLLFGGVSYREEEYEIGAGDPASYAVGPLRDLPVGANGFQGFSPNIAGTFTTDSYAAFVELDADLTDRWTASVAARYEDYAAFGDNFSYKVATRFELSKMFALRGAVSTGFRAPAAGQLFGTSQTSQISPVTNDFILDAVLIPGSPEALVFGSTQLVPETSFNMSAGLVIDGGSGLLATIDFYQIDVDDRLLLTPPIATTPAQRAQLAAVGFPNGASVQQVRFFQNKLNTRVRGVDIVGTYSYDWSGGSSTDISAAINHNEQILRGDPSSVYDSGTAIEFEEGIPALRGNLTVVHHLGDFDFMARGVYYGAWKRRAGLTFLPRDEEILMDAEISYSGFKSFNIAVGARNVFDKMPPDRGPALRLLGNIHDNHSPYGVSGGFYYLSTRFKF